MEPSFILENWSGVAGRDVSDWQGEVPTVPQKAKRQQWPAVGAGLNRSLCTGCLSVKGSSHSNSISRQPLGIQSMWPSAKH